MTAVPSISFAFMDTTHHDEQMDFGSDLPAQDNDVDFDLPDVSRGASAEPQQDVMIDDFDGTIELPPTSHLDAKAIADDEMLDDDVENEPRSQEGNIENDDGQNSATMYDDEDLIYEDEDIVAEKEEEEVDIDFKDRDGSMNTEAGSVIPEVVTSDGSRVNEAVHPQVGDQTNDPAPFGNENDGEESFDNTNTPDDPRTAVNTEPHEAGDEINTSKHDESPFNIAGEKKLGDEGNDAVESMPPTESFESGTDREDDSTGYDNHEDTDEGSYAFDTTALHPVKVQYDGTELCLFPPMEGNGTFFVQDASLAFSPCSHLFGACRDVLGDSIEADRELVLDFPLLGLHLSEGSSYTSELTMAQIIEVYITLCQNDNLETIPALQCLLRTRISLSSQHAFLLSIANSGKGLAEVQARSQSSSDLAHSLESGSAENGKTAANDQSHDQTELPKDSTETDGNSHVDIHKTGNQSSVPEASETAAGKHEVQDLKTSSTSPDVEAQEEDHKPLEDETIDHAGEADPNDHAETEGILSATELGVQEDFDQGYPQPEIPADVTADSESDQTIQGDAYQGSPEEVVAGTDGNAVSVNDFAYSADADNFVVANENGRQNADESEHSYALPQPQATNSDDLESHSSYVNAAAEFPNGTEFQDDASGAEAGYALNASEDQHLVEPVSQPAESITSALDESVENDIDTGDEEDLLTLDEDFSTTEQTTKRKFQDEDVFDLIDPSTPENKKRRPS